MDVRDFLGGIKILGGGPRGGLLKISSTLPPAVYIMNAALE